MPGNAKTEKLLRTRPFSFGGSQCFDHETGKTRCIQTDAAIEADSNAGCEQAGGEGIGCELCAPVGAEGLGPSHAEHLALSPCFSSYRFQARNRLA